MNSNVRHPTLTDFHLSARSHTVRLWLRRRLPLEPKGEVALARKQLVAAIRALDVPTGAVLRASYHTVDESHFDVENVLFYNVGPGTFARVARHGIAFERKRLAPPVAPSGEAFAHYHEYVFADPVFTSPPGAAVSFSFAPPPLASTTKTHSVWWQATAAHSAGGTQIRSNFALRVELGVPYSITNVGGILKSLVDGIVASLHSDPAPSDLAIDRIAQRTGWEAAEIRRRLMAPPNSLLGPRNVVSTYRDFVKWDPADHLCESCQLTVLTRAPATCAVTVANVSPTPEGHALLR